MQIVFFTHPAFQGSQSMPRFAKMLVDGMSARGHQTEVWTPQAFFYNSRVPKSFKKWMGYIDQYLLFPYKVRKRLKRYEPDTLFVFTDHALGPWIPLVSNRPHVIHCHDFLAQRSALGQILENPVSSTGKQYQNYIRKGYMQGKNFISVSERTRQDLHEFLGYVPPVSAMVYNGINTYFNETVDKKAAQSTVLNTIDRSAARGYIVHVGGNQWYKNRSGVIAIYNAWRKASKTPMPLVMIGSAANDKLMQRYNESEYRNDIFLLSGKSDDFVRQAYNGATVLLFPSLAEGFGWPVAEAMACGCPVITTQDAPMTEVGGNAAYYIPRMPQLEEEKSEWAYNAAMVLDQIAELSQSDRQRSENAGYENIKRFDVQITLTQLDEIYQNIVLKN
jgi:glycosyltransferase involved in cell wall biosynthesis